MAYFVFFPCCLNIDYVTFLKMYCDITQTLKLQQSSRKTARCKDHLSQSFRNAKKRRFSKLEASVNPRKPKDNFIDICSSGNSHCQLTSSETDPTGSKKS